MANRPLTFSEENRAFPRKLESQMKIQITNLIWNSEISFKVKFPKGQPSVTSRSFFFLQISVASNMLRKLAKDPEHRNKSNGHFHQRPAQTV